MPAVTIRDVPDETRNVLAARAARDGKSLQEYLRGALIEFADRADVDELVANARLRKASTQATLSADDILEHLQTDRR